MLSAGLAIMMSAAMNFVGALTGQAVAKTITAGLLSPTAMAGLSFNASQLLVIGALVGAIIWNLVTWYFGIPSSSSHALIGGVIGSGIAALSVSSVQWDGVLTKVVIPLIVSPVAGLILAGLLMRFLLWLVATASPKGVGTSFRRLQLVSAAYMAFSHGSNDAQKTMGVITLALFSAGFNLPTDQNGVPNIPVPVIVLAATAMAIGTAAGGWRIIRTMGQRIVHLEPIHGFAAETTAATIIEIGLAPRLPTQHHPCDIVGYTGRRLRPPSQVRALGRRIQYNSGVVVDPAYMRHPGLLVVHGAQLFLRIAAGNVRH